MKTHLLVLLVMTAASVTLGAPQYYPVKPEENWRSVILSRNGPSTSTTPRPSVWITTTLRSITEEPITGTGEASIEETRLANRPRDLFSYGPQPHRSSTSGLTVTHVLPFMTIGLVLTSKLMMY